MVVFDPKFDSIRIPDSDLEGSSENDIQTYIIEYCQDTFTDPTQYILLVGQTKDESPNKWFVGGQPKWKDGHKEWVFDGPDPSNKNKGSKRPDFIFAKELRDTDDEESTADNPIPNFSGLTMDDHSTDREYTIWELKKAWMGSESSAKYCININGERDGEREVERRQGYCIAESSSLDSLIARADSQAKGYADKLVNHVPQGSRIHIRSVVGVMEGEESRRLLRFNFGASKQIHPPICSKDISTHKTNGEIDRNVTDSDVSSNNLVYTIIGYTGAILGLGLGLAFYFFRRK